MFQIKHHRGKATSKLLWVVGLVERSTNRIKVIPVVKRTAENLHKIIQENVDPGATIYTDGFSSYKGLNKKGIKHFSVNHKYNFKQCYVHTRTQEEKVVHTNHIEGAWKHTKVKEC